MRVGHVRLPEAASDWFVKLFDAPLR